MAIMLDADVLIRGEKGAFDLKSWLAGQPNEQFEVAAITVAELWHGVERATTPHRQRRLQYLQALLGRLASNSHTRSKPHMGTLVFGQSLKQREKWPAIMT